MKWKVMKNVGMIGYNAIMSILEAIEKPLKQEHANI